MTKKIRKSLVRVRFLDTYTCLTYYNDLFDLEVGDMVFVSGAFFGRKARVEEVSYPFKIKKKDYERVLSVADTELSGKFFWTERSVFAFDEHTLPYEKVRTWFFPPSEEEDEWEIAVEEGEKVSLSNLEKMKISPVIRERGEEYFEDDRVAYVEIRDGKIRAFVEGSKNYEVTARIDDGVVTELLCDCPYPGTCKHQYAILCYLRETKKEIDEVYGDGLYLDDISLMPKSTFLAHTLSGKKSGTFTFD